MEQYKINLLKLAAKYDFIYDVLWNEDLVFSIACSDVFHHAADAEEITSQEDVDMIEQAAKELSVIKPSTDVWATLLFIARKRKIRPLGNWYLGLDNDIAKLFDACVPEQTA